MNWISRKIGLFLHSTRFNMTLKKMLKLYGNETVELFNLKDFKESYWLDCKKEHFSSPNIVEKSSNSSSNITKHWQFFSKKKQDDLRGILNYILYLQKVFQSKEQSDIFENKVSDHVYEM